MPRVYLTETQKEDDLYIRQIRGRLAERGMTREQLAKAIGLSRGTLTSRFKKPETITRGEDRKIRKLLNMPRVETRM